jgi:hypothetical protein
MDKEYTALYSIVAHEGAVIKGEYRSQIISKPNRSSTNAVVFYIKTLFKIVMAFT